MRISGSAERTSVYPNNQKRFFGVSRRRDMSFPASSSAQSLLVGCAIDGDRQEAAGSPLSTTQFKKLPHELSAGTIGFDCFVGFGEWARPPLATDQAGDPIRVRRCEQDPQRACVSADQKDGAIAANGVEHATNVVDPVLERCDSPMAV
jgi:hypothetical protein